MKIEIMYGSDVFVLPKSNVISNIGRAKELDLKVLLYFASDERLRSEHGDTLAKKLKCSSSAIDESIAFWRGAGVLNHESGQEETEPVEIKKINSGSRPLITDSKPQYSGIEISEILNKNEGLKHLIDECQRILGKIFTPTEIGKIAALSDYLRLENEHILLLFQWCKTKDKFSVHYVEKMAYSLYDEGIDTLTKFEEYIKVREEYESMTGKLRSLFGLGERTLTPKENDAIKHWCVDWQYSFEIVSKAYEITVSNTDKASIPYANKILSNWHDSGYKTLEEINNAIDSHKQAKEMQNNANSSFDTDEFFELALKHSYENMNKPKKQGSV